MQKIISSDEFFLLSGLSSKSKREPLEFKELQKFCFRPTFFFCFEKPVESFGCIAEDRINLCSRLRLNQVEGANGANRLTLSPFEVSKSLSNIQQQQNKAQLFVGSGEIRSDQHFAKRNGFFVPRLHAHPDPSMI